jgi:hypothetical protein
VKEKQQTSAQHMWELLKDCWKIIPGEAGWENGKCEESQWVATLKNRKSYIYLTLFGYYVIPYVIS